MTEPVEICEVAPRDGFQAIQAPIATDAKIGIVRRLAAAGLTRIETGAFVSPVHVPQMADTAEDAFAAGIADIVYVFSVSESHNQANVRRPVAASIDQLGAVIARGREVAGFRLRVNLATVFDCPFEGGVDPDAVFAALERVLGFGHPVEVGLCDTTGRAFPNQVATVCAAAIDRFSGSGIGWAFHGHDTFGLGVANALFAHQAGVRVFDAAAAGLGGCPFAPGATGNTATEDLVFTFANMGVATGVDLDRLLDAAEATAAVPGAQTGGHLRHVPRRRALAAA